VNRSRANAIPFINRPLRKHLTAKFSPILSIGVSGRGLPARRERPAELCSVETITNLP
jgi:hypothetical protein